MKRIISILPIACALLLAACTLNPSGGNNASTDGGKTGASSIPAPSGSTISAEQANALMTEARAHVVEESFVMPTKFSVNYKMDMKGKRAADAEEMTEVMEEKIEYDHDAKCGYMGMIETGGEGENEEMHQWFWSAGGKYYRAYSDSLTDFSEGEYEEMTADEFAEFVAAAEDEAVPGKKDIADMLGSIQSYITSANAYSDPTTMTPEGAVITYNKNKTDATYRSTGAGNLSALFDVDVDANYSVTAEGTTVSGHVAAKFDMDVRMDGYLPIYEDIDYTMLMDGGEEYMSQRGRITATMNWGSCNFQAPDISKFPAPQGE